MHSAGGPRIARSPREIIAHAPKKKVFYDARRSEHRPTFGPNARAGGLVCTLYRSIVSWGMDEMGEL
jgi:hypothetical protein